MVQVSFSHASKVIGISAQPLLFQRAPSTPFLPNLTPNRSSMGYAARTNSSTRRLSQILLSLKESFSSMIQSFLNHKSLRMPWATPSFRNGRQNLDQERLVLLLPELAKLIPFRLSLSCHFPDEPFLLNSHSFKITLFHHLSFISYLFSSDTIYSSPELSISSFHSVIRLQRR